MMLVRLSLLEKGQQGQKAKAPNKMLSQYKAQSQIDVMQGGTGEQQLQKEQEA